MQKRIAPAPETPVPTFDWENFTGARLFAWLGGLALFLGFVFLVKFSIDQGLLSPAVRILLGIGAGLLLIVSGLRIKSETYRVTAQTLCAAGVAILHAVTFAAYQFYGFLGAETAFPLLVFITAGAFFLAVRLDSRYIALLGLLGGFLNPYLVSSGQDRSFALFTYIAILDLGLVLIAVRKRWSFLIPLSALGTVVLQTGWIIAYFVAPKAPTAAAILCSFAALYLAATLYSSRRSLSDVWIEGTAGTMSVLALCFGFTLAAAFRLGSDVGLVFSFLFTINVLLSILALAAPRGWFWHLLGGQVTFLILLVWTNVHLARENLIWALAGYCLFALLHAGLPIAAQRYRKRGHPAWLVLGNLYPALMMIPVLMSLTSVGLGSPYLFWFAILALNAVGLVGLCLLGLPWIGIVFLVMTLIVGWAGLLQIRTAAALPLFLGMLVTTMLGFVGIGLFLGRGQRQAGHSTSPGDLTRLPVLAAWLPFFLLLSALQTLPLPNPHPVFLAGLLLSVSLLLLDRWSPAGPLSLVTLFSVAMLQIGWLATSFDPAQPGSTIFWSLIFLALFALYPFLFARSSRERRWPWWSSALAGPLQFAVVAGVVLESYQPALPGLLPLSFGTGYAGLLHAVARTPGLSPPLRRTRVALFAGVTLFFISLVFPFQWEREWLTLGWTVEGLALIALFRRLNHSGLKKWGLGLLLLAFVRLALNPNVLASGHSPAVLFNVYLYLFGATTICFLLAGHFWKPPGERVLGVAADQLLRGLAAVLGFLLVNIEIANYYSSGTQLRFEFGRNLGQDLSYSLAWGAFGLLLLVVGLSKSSRAARIGALALISTATLKLFFYDLWSLSQLYRVGALLGLAMILVLVSALYQRYFGRQTSR